jgi:hypothetical protein
VNYKSNGILEGIGIRNGEREFWQSVDADLPPVKLRNVWMFIDPLMPGIAGKSGLLTLIPYQSLKNFCLKAQAQKVGRIGAPILFLKFTARPEVNSERDDVALAKKIIQNWGKESPYALRENMEPVMLNFNDNQSAIQSMEYIDKKIESHFNPTTFLQKEATTMGGNDSGKVDVIKLTVQNVHIWLEDAWEPMMNLYLQLNGFDDLTDEIEIPAPEPDKDALNLSRAEAADKMGIATLNEKRKLAGLPEATPEELAEIEKERNQRSAMVPGTKPYGQNQDAEGDGKEGGRPPENA